MSNTILQVRSIEIQEGKFFPKAYSSSGKATYTPPNSLYGICLC